MGIWDTLSDKAKQLKDGAADIIDNAGDAIERGADTASDMAKDFADKGKEAFETGKEIAEKAEEAMDDAVEAGKEKTKQAKKAFEDGKEYVEEKYEDAKEYVEEQKKAYKEAQAKKKAAHEAAAKKKAEEAAAKEKARQEKIREINDRKVKEIIDAEKRRKEKETAPCINKCQTCEKQGLAILLTRYAVATDECNAPKLTGQFGGGDLDSIPLTAKTHYTQRLLRSGYVYVFDENKNQMDEYFVTEDSVLTKLPSRLCIDTKAKPATEFRCARNGHAPVAGCITIENPKQSGTIWIGFSDAKWTKHTYDKHFRDADLRAKHMRKIQISGGKVSPQKHTAPIGHIWQHVPEYMMSDSAWRFKYLFGYSPFRFHGRHDQGSALVVKALAMRNNQEGAAIVALDDPVGVLAELDGLMQHSLEQFNKIGDRARGLALSKQVEDVRNMVRAQAESKAQRKAKGEAAMYEASFQAALAIEEVAKKVEIEAEKKRNVSYAELKKVADKAWKKFSKKYNENKEKKWLENYQKQLKKHDQVHIAPLAVAHTKWMQSATARNYFEHNYDTNNMEHGLVYTESVSMCVGSTQDKQVCFDLYDKWLNGSFDDKYNFILRALALNHDKTAADIKQALSVSQDWRNFPFDGVIGAFGTALDKTVNQFEPDVLGRFMVKLAGNMTKQMLEGADGIVRPGLIALGLYTQKTFTVVRIDDITANFRDSLIRQLSELGEEYGANPNKVKMAVRDELRRLKLAGIDLNAPENKYLLVMIDEAHIKDMPPGLNAEKRARWVSKSIRTMAEYEQLEQANALEWRQKVENPVNKLKYIAGKGVPYISGLAQGWLQYAAYQQLSEAKETAMNDELNEANWRLRSGGMALIGTISDSVGTGLEKLSKTNLRYASHLKVPANILIRIGRVFGMGAAMIMAAFDAINAWDAAAKGQTGMAILYFTSAALGLASAYLLTIATFASATGIGLVLVVLLIAVTFLIEIFKESDLKIWLNKTWWALQPEYISMEQETHDFNQATKS